MSDHLQRTLAQFFFEVGYGACWAEAFVKNDEGPFPLTDVIVERAWDNARDAHEDPIEFDAYQRTADLAPDMAARIERLEAINAELLEKLGSINRLTSPGNRTFDDLCRDMGCACDIARFAIAHAKALEGEAGNAVR